MIKYNYFKLSKSKKIRYLKHSQKNNLYIVFLHGFMSDLEGEKPKLFLKFAIRRRLGFLALEYSGHGKSSGKFTKGNISKWSKETSLLIKKIVKKNNFILIGSSMGSWISTNQFAFFSKQIKGFIGIGSAPEFLERVMWKKFTRKMKRETIENGIYRLKHGGYEYPITFQLIKDGRKNKILHKKVYLKIPVTLFHGKKDDTIPVIYSKKLLKVFKFANKKLIIMKNGDHSLFKYQFKLKILKELKNIVNNYKYSN